MSFRTVAASLVLLSSSIAAAEPDEVSVAPVCAEVDATRDSLTAAERSIALQQLTRVLQDADLLVVEHECTEHYVLAHELRDGALVVRISGPGGARVSRDPDRQALPTLYRRMVDALIDAQDQAAVTVATVEPPTETTYPEPAALSEVDVSTTDTPSGVQTDAVFYAALVAGNYGLGVGFGVRVPTSRAFALDLSLIESEGDAKDTAMLSARLIKFHSPDADVSPYAGGGLSVGNQREDRMTGSGAQIDATLGVVINRTGTTRGFAQATLSIPLFEMTDGEGSSYSPTVMFSIGAGR